MEGINLRELVNKRGNGYRYLVEAVVDHEVSPEDPLTDRILKGAQGIAYDCWPWNGQWWYIALAVQWESIESGISCNYFETYRRKDKVKRPIKEIRFIREFGKDEVLPFNESHIKRADYENSIYFKIFGNRHSL